VSCPHFALLHGGGQGSWVWLETKAALEAEGASVQLLDVPGCGVKRGRDVSTLSADAVAAELVADIQSSGHGETILAGHSLAGSILPRMAVAAPGQFAKLVYVTCSAPLPGVSFRDQMGTGLQGSHPDEVGWPVEPAKHSADDRYRLMFCNDMAVVEADAFLAKMGYDNWPMDPLECTDHNYDHLTEVDSAYIVCLRDAGLPPVWQRRFAQRLHCKQVVDLDAGHQAMTTQAMALAKLLMATVNDTL
jgi:pimeloyl-ACP methyl ester carboxylesterase